MRILIASATALSLAACGAPAGDADNEADAYAENSALTDSTSDNALAGIEPEPGNRWFYESATETAIYGPDNENGIVTVSCNSNLADERALVVQRMASATPGERHTVAMRAGEAETTFEMEGKASAIGPDAIWTGGIAPGSAAATLLADADGPIVFGFPGNAVAVPVSDELGNVVAACT